MHCDVNSLCTVKQSEISQERSKITNFCERSYQSILRYLFAETIKRQGKISVRRHFNEDIHSLLTKEAKTDLLVAEEDKRKCPLWP